MRIAKEVTVGQIFQASVFVIGFVGFVYTLRAELDSVKETVGMNSQEHQSFVKTDEFRQMQQDVREIRNMVFEYVTKTNGSAPGSGNPGQTPDGRGVVRRPSGFNYPDSSYFRGAGPLVRPGSNLAWTSGNERSGRGVVP